MGWHAFLLTRPMFRGVYLLSEAMGRVDRLDGKFAILIARLHHSRASFSLERPSLLLCSFGCQNVSQTVDMPLKKLLITLAPLGLLTHEVTSIPIALTAPPSASWGSDFSGHPHHHGDRLRGFRRELIFAQHIGPLLSHKAAGFCQAPEAGRSPTTAATMSSS